MIMIMIMLPSDNVHTNFSFFYTFVLLLGARTGQMDRQMDRQTDGQ